MGKKSVMGAMVAHLLKELSTEIPENAEPDVENEVTNRLKKILGENWAALPVTGPYMMIVVLVLNYILLPMGVTPVTVADKAISKGKEYDLDTRFNDLLFSAKSTANATGEFTSEKIRELTAYSEEKGKGVSDVLKELIQSSQKIGKSVFDKGKEVSQGVLGSIKDQFAKQDETGDDGAQSDKTDEENST